MIPTIENENPYWTYWLYAIGLTSSDLVISDDFLYMPDGELAAYSFLQYMNERESEYHKIDPKNFSNGRIVNAVPWSEFLEQRAEELRRIHGAT